MKPLRCVHLLIACAALLASGGCSLLLSFDPEGQPCDAKGACLAGYACTQGACHKGGDAGPLDACGGCPQGQRCVPSLHACVPDTCVTKKCPPGYACSDSAGTAACHGIAQGNPGYACYADSACATGQYCWRGAVLIPANPPLPGVPPTQAPGVCVAPCTGLGAVCSGGDGGLTCQPFTLGNGGGTAYACLPPNLLFPCIDDAQCQDDGLVCTAYDHPALGFATLCDLPASGGAPPGLACNVDGGSLCANGLCLAGVPTPGPSQRCAQLCDANTCDAGQSCVFAEWNAATTLGTEVRFAPVCLGATSYCTFCAGDAGTCGPDAPQCTALSLGNVCVPDCAAPGGLACPPATSCDATSHRCVTAVCK